MEDRQSIAFGSLLRDTSGSPDPERRQGLGGQSLGRQEFSRWVGMGFGALASIAYIWSVSYFSDDFSYLRHQATQDTVWGALTPSNAFISLIFEQYTHVFFLYFSSLEVTWLPQVLKTLYVIACLYMCGRFFSLFMPPTLGQAASFLFVFFPSHESTVYWYLGQYLMLTISLYFYAYYLAYRQAFGLAVVFALMASFISYGSPAPAAAMTVLAWRKLGNRQALLLLGPNLLYAMYYVVTSKLMGLGIQRLNDSAPLVLIRQFVFQMFTFADATIGPSVWIKLFYGLGELTLLSASLTLVGAVVFWRTTNLKASLVAFRVDRDLLYALTVMTFVAFSMLAITGRYPNIAFNLGNRTNIFGTALLTFLLLWAWSRTRFVTVIIILFILSVTGISNHWKKWSAIQAKAITDIQGTLEDNPQIKTLFVSGMQYSRLGAFDHIELFSEVWVVSSITELLTEGQTTARPLNGNHRLMENGRLLDIRYDEYQDIPENLYVLDFHTDDLRVIPREKLNEYLATLPGFKRHWLQIIDNEFIRRWILKLMPRLDYVFAT